MQLVLLKTQHWVTSVDTETSCVVSYSCRAKGAVAYKAEVKNKFLGCFKDPKEAARALDWFLILTKGAPLNVSMGALAR
jgi:hypothetical protein